MDLLKATLTELAEALAARRISARELTEAYLEKIDADAYLSDKSVKEIYSNVYNFSIQANLSSAIIKGRLYFRPKKDGDSVYYGGMTHKLKKLFNDKKIALSNRENIPVFCDNEGIFWVPGFKVRDNFDCGEEWYITILNPILQDGKKLFYVFDNRNQKGKDIT